MFRLAREIADTGERVLTTTTTRIFRPGKEESVNIVVSPDVRHVLESSEDCLAEHPHVTAAGAELVPEGKLRGFDPSQVEEIRASGLFRWILVEADGAAGRPLKAPADHEPVIPPCSSLVVGIVGLDGVGKPLDDQYVFRAERFARISGLPLGSPVTGESIACMIDHPDGLFKGCPREAARIVLLNKAEDKDTQRAGKRIASILREGGKTGIDKIFSGAIGREPPDIEAGKKGS
jgi:probable selenium-dependent hydroxylase accessory protein YqeC